MKAALSVPLLTVDAYLLSYGVSLSMLWVYAKARWGLL